MLQVDIIHCNAILAVENYNAEQCKLTLFARLGNYMTLLDLLILLIVAGLCGALGQAITGFSRGGCLVSIALGFVGAVVGMWLARTMGLPELFAVRIGTTNFPIVWSIIGSALFVAIIALLTRRSV